MAINVHYKQPGEKYPLGVDLTAKLPGGATIASAVVTATDESGADATSTVVDGSATVSGAIVTQMIKAGIHGQRYDLKLVASLTGGGSQNIEHDIALFVREE